jgi:hypothetical protein
MSGCYKAMAIGIKAQPIKGDRFAGDMVIDLRFCEVASERFHKTVGRSSGRSPITGKTITGL